MARSVKRRGGAMEYDGLRRFRLRRLLAFLRRNNLPATFDAMKHETGAFFDVQFLQRRVVDGRWQEARGYVDRFLPSRDGQMSAEAHSALRFIAQLNVLDDLAHGKLGGNDAVDDLQMQIEAIPSTMTDPHYTGAVRTVFIMRSHPAHWDPVDWKLVRLKASQIVKDLITQAPEFKHLMRLPRCPIDPRYTIPFGFQGCRRHKRKIGQMPASLLARRFHPKERRSTSPWTRGSLSEPMDLQELIDETLQAGKQEAAEHSDSCEGIPGSPVESSIGKSCGIKPADAVEKCPNQEYYAESATSAKLPRETGEFYSDTVDGPLVGIDPMFVLNKMFAIGEISSAMGALLMRARIGPYHNMFAEKLMEQEKLLHELRVHYIKSKLPAGGTDFTT